MKTSSVGNAPTIIPVTRSLGPAQQGGQPAKAEAAHHAGGAASVHAPTITAQCGVNAGRIEGASALGIEQADVLGQRPVRPRTPTLGLATPRVIVAGRQPKASDIAILIYTPELHGEAAACRRQAKPT